MAATGGGCKLPAWSTEAAGPKPRAEAARPTRVRIPAIGVDARVIALGLNRDGTVQVPRAFAATGWYRPGPEPGERGPAVIIGHLDSWTGPAVFARLSELRSGNLIRVARADGSHVVFTVDRVEHWPKSDFPTRRVYGRTRGAVLRLVTCSGAFDETSGHYLDNTIVYASRRA
jgi:sortase (surface protein transpeptidase)